MLREIEEMDEEELRKELVRVRGERAGKGRQKRKEARTRRIVQTGKDKKRRKDVEAIEEADWV